MAILPACPDVSDVEVDGRAAAELHLDLPVLLERLSVALHRHDTTGSTGALFRSLASGGTFDAVRRRTRTLLADPAVREAMHVVLLPEQAERFRDELHDVLVTTYYGPDDDREPELLP